MSYRMTESTHWEGEGDGTMRQGLVYALWEIPSLRSTRGLCAWCMCAHVCAMYRDQRSISNFFLDHSTA